MAEAEPKRNHRPPRKHGSVNAYLIKKTVSQGLLDVALLTSNAALLRVIILAGSDAIHFYYFLVTLLSLSIILQIVAAMLLFLRTRVDWEEDDERDRANCMNDWATLTVLVITIINIIIGGFTSDFNPGSVVTKNSPEPATNNKTVQQLLELLSSK
ncbi:ninjurin-2-like [Saccoglossus kowalevskii]|uniref:Ninjurin-2-like n=1 Tax=Saccoglossus kowalevskii TaxID=10224 RepID=A0ABM0M352_SACKO|nr:PREDICTED: ninjurin-2-like [Saccoglossus kowalevskii]